MSSTLPDGGDPTDAKHFDGRCFYNPWPVESNASFGCWRWLLGRRPGVWPSAEEVGRGFVATRPDRRCERSRVIWIGHASVLIQIDGLNIITDPIYAEHIGPMPGLGFRRRHPPGIDWADLPPIDAVLVSHAHYDHLDRATIARLITRDNPWIVAGRGLRHWFERLGCRRVVMLDWWQNTSLGIGNPTITAVPAQHWARRGLWDRNRTLWAGFWIAGRGACIYFAGDTGYGPHFNSIRERLGSPDLALLPIGAYEPRGLMKPQHMNPAEAVSAHCDLKARRSVGIHFATFKLTDEGRDQPTHDLADARRGTGLAAEDFIAPKFGQTITIEDDL